MANFVGFDRITTDPDILGGKPCIRSMRISVRRVLEILSEGLSNEDISADYPELEPEDFQQALAFAAMNLSDKIILLNTTTENYNSPYPL